MTNIDSRKERRLPGINDVICGTAVVMNRTCGKKSCRCLRGYKHRSLYISQYRKGAGRMVYISKENERKVLRLVKNYRILKSVMHKASETNIVVFTTGRKKTEHDPKRA